MKFHYRTRLDDDIDGYVELSADIPDGAVVPEEVNFVLSMLTKFIALDQLRADRQTAEQAARAATGDGKGES